MGNVLAPLQKRFQQKTVRQVSSITSKQADSPNQRETRLISKCTQGETRNSEGLGQRDRTSVR
jgi:hypothetical protein